MTGEVQRELDQVAHLVKSVDLNVAETRLTDLMKTMGPGELNVWRPEIQAAIDLFFPKRQKKLRATFEAAIGRDPSEVILQRPTPATPQGKAPGDIGRAILALPDVLKDLSNNHIYQWTTYYRDSFSNFYDTILKSLEADDLDAEWLALSEVFSRHTQEIFTKGYLHVTRNATHQVALSKSMSGLARFMDVVLEAYSASTGPSMDRTPALNVRAATSAVLWGILRGYALAQFDRPAAHYLAERFDRWAHALAFIRPNDLVALRRSFAPDERVALPSWQSMVALSRAIEGLLRASGDYMPLPVTGSFAASANRFSVSLQPGPHARQLRLVEIWCFTDSESVARETLVDAISRDVSLVVAALRPDVRQSIASESIGDLVVNAFDGDTDAEAWGSRVYDELSRIVFRDRSPRGSDSALSYNFAREFPLSDANMSPFYFVVRNSVRELLRTFERRNGVRLWCSVRRSGKTKAGFDLASTMGDTLLISQTCDSTGDALEDSSLYLGICEALERGDQLRPDFLQKEIERTLPESANRRTVLILDEYETLFGRLRTADVRREDLRYTVIQPLLNQMVQFSRSNLLVFLGQQPDAHLILMDQNQLSPYVQQDAFPLFSHGVMDSEFTELVEKVFAKRASFDESFVNRLYNETSGHPYLTVSLLIDYIDWLIASKRTVGSLHFTGADLSQYATRQFRRDRIVRSPQYGFFRDGTISQALSQRARARTPWLHAVYRILQQIALDSPEYFSVSLDDFHSMFHGQGLDELGFSADQLLTTARAANFFAGGDKSVTPRIRLLGRLSGVAVPAMDG